MSTFQEKRNRALLIVLLIPVLFITAWYGWDLHTMAKQRAELKRDYSVLNNIQYGLLSVDRWRDNITAIVIDQIDHFNLKNQQEAQLKEALNEILNSLITEVEKMMDERQKGFKAKLQKFAFKTFVDTDKFRERVPQFSQTIIDEIKDPKNKRRLKFVAKDKLEDFAEKTKDIIEEETEYQKMLVKYGNANSGEINTMILTKTDELQFRMYQYTSYMLANLLLFLLVWMLIRKNRYYYKPVFILSVCLALVILLTGLFIPMIEIDARIKEVNFLLLNRNIQFQDQVIFFQSKSIMDVVEILIKTGKGDSVFVGLLILVFSVIFPITKLLSTEVYLLGKEKWRTNKIVNFFAFHSGKWSMADVMVVAIFMAYVGFKGILEGQLAALNMHTKTITSIATDKTSLQPGFILFIAFVLFSLILSEILKQITKRTAPKNVS